MAKSKKDKKSKNLRKSRAFYILFSKWTVSLEFKVQSPEMFTLLDFFYFLV